MISLVLYGRNDNHGYNLHKRAALSLNCMAEILTAEDDEILFVDYNTPDDLPTFPEAIRDTLTPKAKEKLRILRARPSVHARFRGQSPLATVEPVARNIAVRRSNPRNRWILSTNTDMIFVPRTGASLSDVAAGLPKGFYGIPRFEIPESLWESFDRLDPRGTIEAVHKWGLAAHLNEIVYAPEPNYFDAPGDFQLFERSDLFAMQGFDEAMLLGWHVDANLSKRLYLLYGRVSSLADRFYGYHCDHTRQVTPMHRRRTQNNWSRFVERVVQPQLPQQAETWGCPRDAIEEISLATGGKVSYEQMLSRVLSPAIEPMTETFYTDAGYNNFWYQAEHVLPFAADLIAAQPRSLRIAWFGVRRDMFRLFLRAMVELGFEAPLLISQHFAGRLGIEPGDPVEVASEQDVLDRAGLFYFEFGLIRDETGARRPTNQRLKRKGAEAAALRAVLKGFFAAVAHERARERSRMHVPRQFVALNCVHTDLEWRVRRKLEFGITPFSSRIRHGFIVPSYMRIFFRRLWPWGKR